MKSQGIKVSIFIKWAMAFMAMVCLSFSLSAQIAFAPPTTHSFTNAGVNISAVADLNGDGAMDLLVSNDGALVLTNNGSGVLSSNAFITNASSIVVADVNGDTKPDLIWTDSGANPPHMTIYTNNGSGIFVSNTFCIVDASPSAPVAADVNGDGYQDLINVSQRFKGTNYIYTNDQHGAFQLASTFTDTLGGPSTTISSRIMDVNGDNKPDLILISQGPFSNYVIYTNAGGGHFQLTSNPVKNPQIFTALVMDINNDGWPDLINTTNSSVTILTNDGTGQYNVSTNIPTGFDSISEMIAADMNGDGKPDLILSVDNYSTGINGGPTPGYSFLILTNNGNGSFNQAYLQYWSALNNPLTLAAADLNNDGHIDLICGTPGVVNVTFGTVITGGSISILASVPTLASTLTNGNLTVSWPVTWTNWALLQNTNLSTTNWTASQGIANGGTNKSLTLTSTNNLFFRLAYPNP